MSAQDLEIECNKSCTNRFVKNQSNQVLFCVGFASVSLTLDGGNFFHLKEIRYFLTYLSHNRGPALSALKLKLPSNKTFGSWVFQKLSSEALDFGPNLSFCVRQWFPFHQFQTKLTGQTKGF